MKSTKFNEITIIGPGLIGSSGLALQKKSAIVKKIVGLDFSKKNINNALKINQLMKVD